MKNKKDSKKKRLLALGISASPLLMKWKLLSMATILILVSLTSISAEVSYSNIWQVLDDDTVTLQNESWNVSIGKNDTTTHRLYVNGSLYVVDNITAFDGTSIEWNQGYAWGDHSLAGYLALQQTWLDFWNLSYGWGDHSLAGYIGSDLSSYAGENVSYYNDKFNVNLSNLNSTIYIPDNIDLIDGTLDSGNLASIQTLEDGDYYNISEDSGADPLTVIVNFSDVVDFDSVVYRVYYAGGSGHTIHVGLWDTDEGDYEEEYGEITDMDGFATIVVSVFDISDHIDSGAVSLRFYHDDNGIPSHDFQIDYCALIDGFSGLVSSNHDALSNRDADSNHPQYSLIDGTRNYTGKVIAPAFQGDGGNLTNVSSYWDLFPYTTTLTPSYESNRVSIGSYGDIDEEDYIFYVNGSAKFEDFPLDDLTNVDETGRTANDFLKWNGASWIPYMLLDNYNYWTQTNRFRGIEAYDHDTFKPYIGFDTPYNDGIIEYNNNYSGGQFNFSHPVWFDDGGKSGEDFAVEGNHNVTKDSYIDGSLYVGVDAVVTGDVTGANLNIADWNTAFGWGDHLGIYSLLNHMHDFNYSGYDNDLNQSNNVVFVDVTATDDMFLSDKLLHYGDTNTYLGFQTDYIDLVSGNLLMMRLLEGGTDYVVFNENSADIDFRVESDDNAYMFYIDGNTNEVGIGDSSPDADLDIAGDCIVDDSMKVSGEILGDKHTVPLTFSRSTMIGMGVSHYMYSGTVHHSTSKGLPMMHRGSITGVSVIYDVTAQDGNYDLQLRVSVNGASVWQNVLSGTTGNDKVAYFTQARDTDDFSGGNDVTAYLYNSGSMGSYVTVNDVIILIEYVTDT